MARSTTPPLLSELRSASSLASQVKALRQLKNEIIGHEQRKQYWVALGILRPLVRVLNSSSEDGGRAQSVGTDGEDAKLQAIIIVGSLAHGGPSFIPPLHASLAFPSLLRLLSLNQYSAPIILQTLRTINNIAESLSLSIPSHQLHAGFINTLYTSETLRNLAILLDEQHSFGTSKPHVELIASLISRTCSEEYQRKMIDDSTVLEALSGQLKTWIATTFLPQVEELHVQWEPRLTVVDMSPIEKARLTSVLHAVGVIVQGSITRAQRLLSICESIFQYMDRRFNAAWENFTASLPASLKSRVSGPPTSADCLLPSIATSQLKPPSSHALGLPPLDPIKTALMPGKRSLSTAVEIFSSHGLERVGQTESNLVPWLANLGRTSDELIGLASTWLLGILYDLNLTKNEKDTVLALLTVPPLVRILDKNIVLSRYSTNKAKTRSFPLLSDQIRADAPAILAKLTNNNPRCQKAAVDAGAIKKLSQLLKQTYDPVNAHPPSPMWSADNSKKGVTFAEDESARPGPGGLSPTASYIMRIRENTLVALAALASDKDEYRKATIENGVLAFVVRALKAEDVDCATSTEMANEQTSDIDRKIAQSNCRESIIAACGVVKALSRSVSTLRTSLMDAGLASPLFSLLKSQDMPIKVSATGVICNLVLEFSPMRNAVIEGGIIRILCDHAHSNHAPLRLNSLWALKHLVVNSPMELRKQCVEGLGMPWLKHIISSEPEIPGLSRPEDGNITPLRMSTPNAAGEQVDLLNAMDEYSRESSQAPEEDGDEDTRMSDSIGSLSKSEGSLKGGCRTAKPRPILNLHNTRSPSHHFAELPDDVAIVKQGLEFLRNLIVNPNESEMMDYVLREMGPDDLFKILASKIRPRVLNAFNRDRKSSECSGMRHIQPNSEIVISVIFCLVHFSAGRVRHKQLLINQPKLLELLLPLLSHPEPDVRAACSWIPFNLTWKEDGSDLQGSRDRTKRIIDLGFYEKLREMEHDPDLNCKERAKNTLQQMQSGLR